jgi:hypothetical protein
MWTASLYILNQLNDAAVNSNTASDSNYRETQYGHAIWSRLVLVLLNLIARFQHQLGS